MDELSGQILPGLVQKIKFCQGVLKLPKIACFDGKIIKNKKKTNGIRLCHISRNAFNFSLDALNCQNYFLNLFMGVSYEPFNYSLAHIFACKYERKPCVKITALRVKCI